MGILKLVAVISLLLIATYFGIVAVTMLVFAWEGITSAVPSAGDGEWYAIWRVRWLNLLASIPMFSLSYLCVRLINKLLMSL